MQITIRIRVDRPIIFQILGQRYLLYIPLYSCLHCSCSLLIPSLFRVAGLLHHLVHYANTQSSMHVCMSTSSVLCLPSLLCLYTCYGYLVAYYMHVNQLSTHVVQFMVNLHERLRKHSSLNSALSLLRLPCLLITGCLGRKRSIHFHSTISATVVREYAIFPKRK